jgi:hypothetical protein
VRSLLWFLTGIVGGFIAAHLVNKDPRGHDLLAQVDARIGEFTERMGTAYRDQEAQFSGLVDEAKDAAAAAVAATADLAASAADAMKDAAAVTADAVAPDRAKTSD